MAPAFARQLPRPEEQVGTLQQVVLAVLALAGAAVIAAAPVGVAVAGVISARRLCGVFFALPGTRSAPRVHDWWVLQGSPHAPGNVARPLPWQLRRCSSDLRMRHHRTGRVIEPVLVEACSHTCRSGLPCRPRPSSRPEERSRALGATNIPRRYAVRVCRSAALRQFAASLTCKCSLPRCKSSSNSRKKPVAPASP